MIPQIVLAVQDDLLQDIAQQTKQEWHIIDGKHLVKKQYRTSQIVLYFPLSKG